MRHVRHIALFFLLLIACSFVLFLIYMDVEAKTVAQVNSEQMVHAEQAAQGIQRYFRTYNSTLAFLAGNDHIILLDPEGTQMLREFYVAHSDEILSVSRVDENGILIFTYPFETSSGANVSGQAHVKKSLETHTVVISDVFTSVQGFRTMALAMPVFANGTYRGTVSILIPFDSFSRKNLEPVRVLSTGNAWLISQNGTILYSQDPAQIDKSALSIYRNSPSTTAFIADAMSGEPGISTYTIEAGDNQNRFITYEAVHNPVWVGDVHWAVIVATPRNEVLGTLQTLQRDLALVFFVLIGSLIYFTYFVVRARGIIREEEKRKAAEDALRESERNYRSIIANMQDIFYRTDRDDNITMISPSGVGQFGLASEKEALGRPIRSFYVHPEERDMLWHTVKEWGSVSNIEVQLRRADNSIITVLTNSHAVSDAEGNFTGVEGVMRDITARKRTETSLQLATRKLNLLTTITTTNIRNAAFTLSGYLELELQQTSETLRKEYHDRQIALLDQINHWLNTARNYQDLGLRPPMWHNVNTAVIFAVSHLDYSKMKRRTEVDGLEIYADPMLETVFLNLAENVLVHGKTATLLTVRYEKSPSGLTLIFEDNGAGIPDPQKQKIFTREFSPVTGMGLFMAREILEITGISITETGTYGKGARFEIHVPHECYRFMEESPDTAMRKP